MPDESDLVRAGAKGDRTGISKRSGSGSDRNRRKQDWKFVREFLAVRFPRLLLRTPDGWNQFLTDLHKMERQRAQKRFTAGVRAHLRSVTGDKSSKLIYNSTAKGGHACSGGLPELGKHR